MIFSPKKSSRIRYIISKEFSLIKVFALGNFLPLFLFKKWKEFFVGVRQKRGR